MAGWKALNSMFQSGGATACWAVLLAQHTTQPVRRLSGRKGPGSCAACRVGCSCALMSCARCVLRMQSVAMQDIEIAPRTSRGFFLLVHVLGYAFGCCAVAVVGYFVATQSSLGWRLLFAMGTLPALAVLAVTPWLYETPHRWGRSRQGCRVAPAQQQASRN